MKLHDHVTPVSPLAKEESPAVTVGIPTHNRADGLERALRSVLAQSETDLEIIVADDASTDRTAEVVRQASVADPRIRYLHHEQSIGLTANFNSILGSARGEYVMLLADDDWLEQDYVARCRAELDADHELGLVSGSPIYHEPGGSEFAGRDINLPDDDPRRRVRRYFGVVTDNVCIYGLIRRSLLEQALPMRNCLAGDWLLIARLAFLAKIKTNTATHIHRSTDGTSANFSRTVRRMGLTSFEERHPHAAIMRFICADIAHDAPVYARLPARSRHMLGIASAAQIARTRPMGLIIEELLSKPPLRPLYGRFAGSLRRRAS